jgi:hypothetical protein
MSRCVLHGSVLAEMSVIDFLAVLSDLAGFADVPRGKEYSVLDHPLMQARRALAPRSMEASPRKPAGAQPLRLPTDPGGTRGRVLPRGRGHASRREEEESRWVHTRGRCLRPVRNAPAATRLHGLRCRRVVPAPWCTTAQRSRICDQEIDPDRWCSHSASLQECWQVEGTVDLERGSWNWGISFILIRSAQPNFLRLSLLHRTRLRPQDMLLLRWACAGSRVTTRDKTLPSGLMGRCGVPASQRLIPHEQRRAR